jgi:acetyl-CoA C-acetyltransferase
MTVYIVDALRTPMGRRNGGLSQIHPADLGAHVLNEIVNRNDLNPSTVDDVVFGCIAQIGAQTANVARTSWLAAGLPDSVPAVTVDRQCGSSQQAIHFAAQGIAAGSYDLAIAGGLEVMSLVPLNSAIEVGPKLDMGYPFAGDGWTRRFGAGEVHQFYSGERIIDKWHLTRAEMDEFAYASNEKASVASQSGRFDREIVPVAGVSSDETIRTNASLEKMSRLSPITPNGRITAATSSQIADGAACVLLASDDAVRRFGLKPRAVIRTMVVVGSDPELMLTGPIPATAKALDKAGLSINDIDLFECNEAFACVVMAWARETGAPLSKVNVNGGAIALGHALGATGARLMTTLLHELEQRDARLGLETVCSGGGLAAATIIERV